jgi:hypothetical protein
MRGIELARSLFGGEGWDAIDTGTSLFRILAGYEARAGKTSEVIHSFCA